MKKEEERFLTSAVMEGMVSIRAVIASRESGTNDRPIEKVLYDRERASSHKGELGYLRAVSSKHGFTLEESDAETISGYTTGNSHGGIIALCGERSFSPLTAPKENGFYMMLDGVEDPYNFGYALRSIYAAGCDGVILPPRNWMTAAGVVCRASAGASERMDLYTGDPCEAASLLKSKGYSIVAADKDDAVSVYETALCRPILLIVGGEKRGISRSLSALCDRRVCLEYGRDFPAALSAASASSILAFEVLRAYKTAK